MKTSDFMNKVTVEGLNKQLRKDHGITVDIEKYSKAQLESYSKKIEAKLHKFETSNKFNESLVNENYHKNKLIHKIVETALNQYIEDPLEDDLDIEIEDVDMNDPAVAQDFAEDDKDDTDADGEPEPKDEPEADDDEKAHSPKVVSAMAMAALRSMMDDPSKMGLARRAVQKITDHETLQTITPQELDAIRGPLEKFFIPILDKGMQGVTRTKPILKTLGAEESMQESVIREGEEDKAALVMASKDMVDKFTAFLEDVAEMSAEGMLQIQDQIRDEMGAEQAQQFVDTIGPALEATIETLKTSRETLNKGVGIITGEAPADDTIGAEPEAPADDAMATDPIDPEGDDAMDMPADDEFGASDAATGGTEPEGREKRESYTPKKKSIAESTRIFSTLSK